ncbi:MAG: hypothetical protein V3V92_03510 [Candidatus Hydrothermarchaeales archaeon]
MECSCGREYTVYDLFPRSYRLYIYLCDDCMKGFLAHHFDTNLDIYNLKEVDAKRFDGMIFIMGLELDPRVFEFEIEKEDDKEAVVVVDERSALGELVENGEKYLFAPYSWKAEKRLSELLKNAGIEGSSTAERVAVAWKRAK